MNILKELAKWKHKDCPEGKIKERGIICAEILYKKNAEILKTIELTKKEVLELIDERIEFLKEFDSSSHQIQIRAEFLLLKSRITEDRSKE